MADHFELGKTVLGRAIDCLHFVPPRYAQDKPKAILFGAIHGDEPLGVYCLGQLVTELLAMPPGRPTPPRSLPRVRRVVFPPWPAFLSPLIVQEGWYTERRNQPGRTPSWNSVSSFPTSASHS